MLTHCKACGEADLVPLWTDRPALGWGRCLCCGSDSADRTEADTRALYGPGYSAELEAGAGGAAGAEGEVRSNCDWLTDHIGDAPKTFLDVGCADGAALRVMAGRGWAAQGFDVATPSYATPPVAVAPSFVATQFAQRFGAVLCREVIEHVDGWRAMLAELHGATIPGGLCQVQTPRPTSTYVDNIYQLAHLVILAPTVLRVWLERTGLDVIDYRLWAGRQPGQAWLCRRPR